MELNGTLPADNFNLPIAVDTMGGDLGFGVQVEGAVQAFKEFGAISILVGPENDLRARLESLGAANLPLRIKHAPDVITMDDSPVKSVRKKPNASLCVAYNLVQSGQAAAVLSAGNSGAMMAAGRFICGLLPGIERPAIATLIPVVGDGRPNVIIDSGANVDCHAHNLLQFAIMGAVYCTSLFGVAKPRVALLSNGTEPSKGTDIIRSASLLLSSLESISYVGYVEGRDVAGNAADVIVCDGFVGNVVLKSMEGCVRLIFEQLRHDSKKSFLGRLGIGLSKPIYKKVFAEKFDYTAYGGAPLLGLKKLAVVLHGSSGSRAVKNAIRIADSFSKNRMVEKIATFLSQLEDHLPDLDGDILSGVFNKEAKLPGDRNRQVDNLAEAESDE